MIGNELQAAGASGPSACLAHPLLPSGYRVVSRTQETPDAFTLELEPIQDPGASPRKAPAFGPGQFNMLYLFGVGEVPISISGDPGLSGTVSHTIREVGAVTRAMARLEPGAALGLRGPYGVGWPMAELSGKDVLVVAGGIGLAPLRPVLYQLFTQRAAYGRVVLLVGARTARDLLYGAELAAWSGLENTEVRVTVDHAHPAWKGEVGVVPALLERAQFDPVRTVALACGPEVMMRFSVREFHKRGLRDEQIYLSLERNMKCGVGCCGHCQWGPQFVCKDGPVYRYDRIAWLFGKKEL